MLAEKKKILILYAPLGAGHGRAAEALREAFTFYYPGFEVKSISALDFSFWPYKKFLPGLFHYLSSKASFIYSWLYKNLNHDSGYKFFDYTMDLFIKKKNFINFVKDFNPDFIIATNPFPMHLVSFTKHEKIINIPSANVCTDFGFHATWFNSDVNYYFVGEENIKESLVKSGADSEKVFVTGIPISKKFLNVSENRNGKTLMIVGGKMSCGLLRKVIKEIKLKNSFIRFIIIAGREKKLLNCSVGERILGFVNNIEEFMAQSDLILTKAGGLTVSECMQMSLPMVINDFLPGQEEDNVDFVVKNGAGIKIKNNKESAQKILDLFSNPEKLAEMKKNCKRIARPEAAEKIVDFIANKLV